MRKPTIVIVVAMLGILGVAQARAERANGAGEGLHKELVKQLLGPADRAEASTTADSSKPGSEPKAERSPQVGRAVVAVPTWPVVALCLFLGGLFLWLKRGRPGRFSGVEIRRLATVPLGGKRGLALVEVEGERLLLGLADRQVSLLAKMPASGGSGAAGKEGGNTDDGTHAGDESFFDEQLKMLIGRSDGFDSVSTSTVAKERIELDGKFADFWSR